MIYLKVGNGYGEMLSRAIMRLLRPAHLRSDDDTDMYCAVAKHPATGETALVLPETELVPLHREATGVELASLLDVFVNDEALTQAEADGVASAVAANAGKRVAIADFVPPSWEANVLTEEQAVAGGWLDAPANEV